MRVFISFDLINVILQYGIAFLATAALNIPNFSTYSAAVSTFEFTKSTEFSYSVHDFFPRFCYTLI